MKLQNKKYLVAFFSHKGQNYSNGTIVDLEKGNTAVVADMIVEMTGADLFEICSSKEYPYEYRACVNVAVAERKEDARPDLAEDLDISEYQQIFLGYPNWCGTMPMPVWTFLENHAWEGKTILPFCTNEGSGMGNSEADIKKLAANAEVKKGLSIHGTNAANSKDDIKKWLEEVEFTK